MSLLKAGSVGDDVRNLQGILNLVITTPPPLKTDRIFGSKTRARVVQFQTNSGLTPDGIVGPVTGKALVAAVLTATLTRR
jgi:peptidoglycan hydrolase-like protein with peptidoglycan-binding domain